MSCKRCGHICIGKYCEQCACEVAGRTPLPRRKRKAKPGRGGSVHTIPTAFETDRRHH